MSNKKSTPQNQEPKYTPERILGEGSSATVYFGTDEKGNPIVIKQFKNSISNTHYKEKVEREIETLRQINHPQIPKYLDYFEKVIEKRRLPHLVMEYKEGPTLETYLNDNRLQIDQILTILKEILLLLQYIHSLQPALIHRDIKPSNIIIQENTPPNIVLIDFGIAVDDIQKTFGHTLNAGTLSYRAPEQVRGEPLIQSDLYSVGVIAFEMLTKTSAKTVFLNLENNTWERKFLQTKLSTKWYRWLEKMLDTNPKNRFASSKEAIQQLPEIDLQQSKKQIKRATQLAHAPKPMEIPKEDFVQDALSQLQQEAERQKLEKIAKELEEKEQERIRKEAEERRKIEEELKIKERRRITRERQQQIEEKRRKKEEAIQRKKEEAQRRKTAIESYKKHVEQNVSVIWDQMIQQIVADELDVKGILQIFVNSTKDQMTFVYKASSGEEERIPISIVEFELAQFFPKVSRSGVDAYLKKMRRKINERIQKTESYKKEQKMLTVLQEQINEMKQKIAEYNKEKLSVWQKIWGKEKELQQLISEKEIEIQNIQRQIRKANEKQVVTCEKFLQPYLFKWEILEDGDYRRLVQKEEKKRKEYLQQLMNSDIFVPYEGDDFYVMKTQVTQQLWKTITNQDPSHFKGDDLPVENVSWFDCILFANLLSEKLGLEKVYEIPKVIEETCRRQKTYSDTKLDGYAPHIKMKKRADGYRLPTELEWEYAAKGSENCIYAGSNDLGEVAWYGENSCQTHTVGQKKSNGYGLHDMSGNVYEWCFDSYESSSRILRGGGWVSTMECCRITHRSWDVPSYRFSVGGIRLVRNGPSKK